MNGIKYQRKKKSMTQTELAKAVGVSQTTVCQWESDEYTPRVKTLQKLAKILGCSIDELFGEVKEA